MEQSTTTRTEQTPRPHQEATTAAGPGWRLALCLIGFGLLLTVTLAIDALSDASSMSELVLVFAGIMLCAGVAELLDPAARRLVAGVRYGGMAMALLGLVLQFVG